MNFLWKRKIPLLTAKAGYRLWASSYHREVNPVKSYSDQFIESSLPDMAGLRVLDAGCGPGKFCRLAEEAGAESVTGIDLSEEMVAQARLQSMGTTFICDDLAHVTLGANAYDLVICALVLGHCENIHDPLRNLTKSLRSRGTLLITDFHPLQSMSHAKRTFQDPHTDKTFEIRHYTHHLDTYHAELASLGFRIEVLMEPLWSDRPLIFGIKATKN